MLWWPKHVLLLPCDLPSIDYNNAMNDNTGGSIRLNNKKVYVTKSDIGNNENNDEDN